MKNCLVMLVVAWSVATARAETAAPQNAVLKDEEIADNLSVLRYNRGEESRLLAGQTACAAPFYNVKDGDTPWSIAKAHGLDYAQLCRSNGKPQDRCSIRPGEKIIVGELLDASGDIALFAGTTESDIAFNKSNGWLARNSLFMRRRTSGGTDEWQLIMTAEGDWKLADGMSEWSKDRARDARKGFQVVKARMSKDHRFVWMVCDPHTSTYYLVCSLELATKKFRVLTDGCAVTEQADGTLFIEGKKTYRSDESGAPDGAAWCDLWISSEGKVIRKTRPISKDEMEME